MFKVIQCRCKRGLNCFCFPGYKVWPVCLCCSTFAWLWIPFNNNGLALVLIFAGFMLNLAFFSNENLAASFVLYIRGRHWIEFFCGGVNVHTKSLSIWFTLPYVSFEHLPWLNSGIYLCNEFGSLVSQMLSLWIMCQMHGFYLFLVIL